METPAPLSGGRRWHTREDSGFRLDAEGRLWHDGELVENRRVSLALRQGIEREEGGRYVMRFGWDWCVLEVEDAPFQVSGLHRDGAELVLALDDGRDVRVPASAIRVSSTGVLYASLPGPGADLEARLSRAAQGQLAPLIEERGEALVLVLGSEAVPLAPR